MKLYKLKEQDIDLLQTALTGLSRSVAASYTYANLYGYTNLRPFMTHIEYDTSKLSAILENATVFMNKTDEQINAHAEDTGFDFENDDFDEVIDNNTSTKPLSPEAKAKVQSLWWKSHDDYLKIKREQEQGLWDDLSEEHKTAARERQYKECQVWNEIMSLARMSVDNTNE